MRNKELIIRALLFIRASQPRTGDEPRVYEAQKFCEGTQFNNTGERRGVVAIQAVWRDKWVQNTLGKAHAHHRCATACTAHKIGRATRAALARRFATRSAARR